MQYCHTGPLVGWVKKKTSSILIMNLIPLGNLSSPSKEAFFQEEINK
jgi:hypothetical protein